MFSNGERSSTHAAVQFDSRKTPVFARSFLNRCVKYYHLPADVFIQRNSCTRYKHLLIKLNQKRQEWWKRRHTGPTGKKTILKNNSKQFEGAPSRYHVLSKFTRGDRYQYIRSWSVAELWRKDGIFDQPGDEMLFQEGGQCGAFHHGSLKQRNESMGSRLWRDNQFIKLADCAGTLNLNHLH